MNCVARSKLKLDQFQKQLKLAFKIIYGTDVNFDIFSSYISISRSREYKNDRSIPAFVISCWRKWFESNVYHKKYYVKRRFFSIVFNDYLGPGKSLSRY